MTSMFSLKVPIGTSRHTTWRESKLRGIGSGQRGGEGSGNFSVGVDTAGLRRRQGTKHKETQVWSKRNGTWSPGPLHKNIKCP